jgi:hypothetical protein
MILKLITPVLSILLASVADASNYAIVVQEEIKADPGWKAVCNALAAKHPDAEMVTWKADLVETLPALSKSHPTYTCFVAPCSAVGPDFVAAVHRLTRRYDDDPYTDTRWGILTGYDAATALDLAMYGDKIEVARVSTGTAIAMEMVSEAICYDELVAGKRTTKHDNKVSEETCPTDTTKLLAETLTDWKSDLFITSGHGFARGWQIGFSYKNGFFQSEDGKLFGRDVAGKRFEIHSDHPRVYLPIGNCLIGRIDDKDAFAIAMMKNAGVKGMIGYTVPTWFGYAGWGCMDTFVEQPGRYTLNEAFLANEAALIQRLTTAMPDEQNHNPKPGTTEEPNAPLSEAAKALGIQPGDVPGLLHDRDVLAYYGDPALDARMEKRPCAYDQTLTKDGDVYTLTITGNRGDRSFSPVNTNGSQRGGRPMVVFLPQRIGKAKILEGTEFSPVITDDFILVPNPGKGERMVVKFRAGGLG